MTVRVGRRHAGFTLIEVVIALAIFAVIGVMAARLLTGMLTLHERTTERGARLTEVQRAMEILARDLQQLTHRGVRDELGDLRPAVEVGGATPIEFTRMGWQNPLALPRAELQRVAYAVEENALYRMFWPVLDRSPDSEPQVQRLLDDVESLTAHAIDTNGEAHAFWPPLVEPGATDAPQLAGVALQFNVPPYGEVTRLWTTAVTTPDLSEDDPGGPGGNEAADDASEGARRGGVPGTRGAGSRAGAPAQ